MHLLAMACFTVALNIVSIMMPEVSNLRAAEVLTQIQLRSMLSDGRGFGTKICATGELSTKADIKPKAWRKIQKKCTIYSIRYLDKFGKGKQGEIYSVCVGGALEACQRAVGIDEPCMDLKSCRASLGVP